MQRKLVRTLVVALGLAAAGIAQAQVSDDVVRLGVMNDMAGPYSDVTGVGSVIAAEMAVEDFLKESGSKLKIEVISADHQNKADLAANIARKWYDADGVDAIVDVPASSAGLAVNEVTRDKGKAFLAVGSGTTELSGKSCSPNTVQWLYDTWLQANGTATSILNQGGDTWFLLVADYAYGYSLEKEASQVVKENGGKMLGTVRVPLGTPDYSSFLLQAQASKAKIIGLGNAGGDTINSIKQAAEFGIVQGGQNIAAFLLLLPDIHGLGLEAAQGLLTTVSFYWDLNEGTRAWTQRFVERSDGKYPTMVHAGSYSAVLNYLRAVEAIGSDDGTRVIAELKKTRRSDPLFGEITVRADGRALHDAYLVQVKTPNESKYPYDYFKVLETIPGEKTAAPLGDSQCPLVTKS